MPASPDAPPFQLLRLDHVVLRVADSQRSIAFYAQALGCTVVKRRDDLGLVHLRAGASMIDLVALDGPLGRKGGAGAGAEGRNVDHVCLRVEPFDEAALVRHLTASGAPPLAPATTNFGAEGSGPSLYFRDPDGNTIELKGASTP
jgi:glyoxylase I family protein